MTLVASPTFSVVPARHGRRPRCHCAWVPFVSSGGYTLAIATDPEDDDARRRTPTTGLASPPIKEVQLVQDIEGRSPIEDYEAGRLDYLPLGPTSMRLWISL